MRHDHTGAVTIIHKLDPAQFAVITQMLATLIAAVGSPEDAAAIKALTAKLKAADEELSGAVNQAKTTT